MKLLDYTYNFSLGASDNGNVTAIANNRDNTRSQNFSYDSLNRLSTAQTQTTGVTIPNPNCWGLTFGYDPWGNLLTSSTTDPTGPGDPGGGAGPTDRERQFQDCLKKFGDKYAKANLDLKGFDAAGAAAAAARIDQSAVLSLWENENKLLANFPPRGPAGEIGPIQVRPGVVTELRGAGILPTQWDSNLQANLTTGALYYERMSSHYNIPEINAAAAYNGGPYGYKGVAAQGYQQAFNASQPGFRDLVNCMR